jgi:hypothetical protein
MFSATLEVIYRCSAALVIQKDHRFKRAEAANDHEQFLLEAMGVGRQARFDNILHVFHVLEDFEVRKNVGIF